MLRDVGIAVAKATETRYRDGSDQARQDIQRLHKSYVPTSYFLSAVLFPVILYHSLQKNQKEVGMGLLV